ncbi:MAG: phosphoribosylformylglycinamidine synthase subunit PurL [Armatimonadetes bacterium]|nr:phosphoribosylformylglycinamidine synthase subunit PurL [Armatimonadota bacterium]
MPITNTPPIDPKVYREMGLSDDEYKEVTNVLGRHPTYTEVGMYAVMWSEHCGYKYSRPILRYFKKYKEAIDGAGLENAGIIDIGDGYGIVFKIESHNHPSAVEPFQGAATGVGGILRDIFTMGARPIASLNSLRFGGLDDARNRYLFEHVVGGIGFYGNCVGVPTVAGEIYFEDCYSGNCLVNAMAVGVMKHEDVAYAKAEGPGNPVMLVGSRTGRDGIHGATFASVELSEESESRKSNVQMGDPFTEKLLIEATLESLKTGYIVGIQDMGAAGITCSTCETSAKAGTGMKIDVRKVPLRESGMSSYEIMLSESQERMLAIVKKGHEDDVAKVFKKWGLQAVVIGEVTDDGLVHVYDGDELVAEVPAKSLADDAPTYHLETEEPHYLKGVQGYDLSKIAEPDDYNDALMRVLASPSIASKEWVYEQYDHMVQTNTAVLPGSDAAVIRIRGTKKAIAMTTDCNGRYCYLDPYAGAQLAVAEAARNLACTGARPIGTTDCLNFGNPEKPEAFWQFKRAVEGLADACEFFGAPVVSGNVSFYNETPEMAIYPTPVIGLIGLIEDSEKRCTARFRDTGDIIVLISGTRVGDVGGRNTPDQLAKGVCALESLGGSEYLNTIHGLAVGTPPMLDLDREKRVHEAVIRAIGGGLIKSAHDCADGGLAIALAECCIMGRVGADVSLSANCAPAAALFAETQSRIVVSTTADKLGALREIIDELRVESTILGKVGGERLAISINDVDVIGVKVADMQSTWRNAIGDRMKESGT